MGGTFDPIHHGHLVAASETAAVFGLDEVVFVPTGDPWQKSDVPVSPAEQRYLMTVIATASNPGFTVSRVDIDRPGPTYTIDTLRDLRARHPGTELFFITGADALARAVATRGAGVADQPARDPRPRDLVHRLPRSRAGGTAGLVPRPGRGRAVHREVRALPNG